MAKLLTDDKAVINRLEAAADADHVDNADLLAGLALTGCTDTAAYKSVQANPAETVKVYPGVTITTLVKEIRRGSRG